MPEEVSPSLANPKSGKYPLPGSPFFCNEDGKRYEEAFGHDASLHKIVRLYSPSDASVLDCSCGTGRPVSCMVAEYGRQPRGIDFSPNMVELSKEQVPRGVISMLQYAPLRTSSRNFRRCCRKLVPIGALTCRAHFRKVLEIKLHFIKNFS